MPGWMNLLAQIRSLADEIRQCPAGRGGMLPDHLAWQFEGVKLVHHRLREETGALQEQLAEVHRLRQAAQQLGPALREVVEKRCARMLDRLAAVELQMRQLEPVGQALQGIRAGCAACEWLCDPSLRRRDLDSVVRSEHGISAAQRHFAGRHLPESATLAIQDFDAQCDGRWRDAEDELDRRLHRSITGTDAWQHETSVLRPHVLKAASGTDEAALVPPERAAGPRVRRSQPGGADLPPHTFGRLARW